MKNKPISSHSKDKPITEGYLAGGASLIVSILWIIYSPFSPFIILILLVISLFCLALSTFWLIKERKKINEEKELPDISEVS